MGKVEKGVKNVEKQKICPLCKRHAKVQTQTGTQAWLEWGEDGLPRLFMDNRSSGGGLNALNIYVCPFCGKVLEHQEADYAEG